MDDDTERLRTLADEADVRRAIGHYFYCLDRRDFDGFARVFTPDAIGVYGGVGAVTRRGLAEIVDGMRAVTQFATTSHITSSQAIDVHGDDADADTYCVCFNQTGDGATMLIRGIHYLDRLRRTSDGWRIAHRRHDPLWEIREAVTAPTYLRSGPARGPGTGPS
jgi:ketosteroid isomerase-like protein